MSPDFTASPSCFSHLTSVPTVMVSLSFGMSMIWAMGSSGEVRQKDTESEAVDKASNLGEADADAGFAIR